MFESEKTSGYHGQTTVNISKPSRLLGLGRLGKAQGRREIFREKRFGLFRRLRRNRQRESRRKIYG